MFHHQKTIKALALALLASFALGTAGTAFAGKWQQHHPRRTQVNSRLNNQNRRIHAEVQKGEISKQQAAGLHRQDRQIRQEERDMASQNGTHITHQEQRTLNQQENSLSNKIGH